MNDIKAIVKEIVDSKFEDAFEQAFAMTNANKSDVAPHTETNEEINPYTLADALRVKARLLLAQADVIEATENCYLHGVDPTI